MASGTGVRARLEANLRKVNATHRVVKFRRSTRSGGNSRLGLGGSLVVETVDVDPQPVVTMVDAEDISTSGGMFQFGDYKLIFGGSVSEDVLKNYQILYGDEILQIVKYRPTGVLQQVVVGWTVFARTVAAS